MCQDYTKLPVIHKTIADFRVWEKGPARMHFSLTLEISTFCKMKPKSPSHNCELPAWDTPFFNTYLRLFVLQKVSSKSDEYHEALNTPI